MRLVWWVAWAAGLVGVYASGPQVIPACVAPSERELKTSCGGDHAASDGVTEALAGARRRHWQRRGVLREQTELAASQDTHQQIFTAVHGENCLGMQPAVSHRLAHQAGDSYPTNASSWRPEIPMPSGWVYLDSQNPQFRALLQVTRACINILGMESTWNREALMSGLNVVGSVGALLSYVVFLSSVSAWRPVTPFAYLHDIGVHVDSQNLQFRAHYGDLGLHDIFEMESAWSWVALIRVCLWGERHVALLGIPSNVWGTIACGCFVGSVEGGGVWRASFACYIQE